MVGMRCSASSKLGRKSIVAAEVTQAANDAKQLVPMADAIRASVGVLAATTSAGSRGDGVRGPHGAAALEAPGAKGSEVMRTANEVRDRRREGGAVRLTPARA